MNWHHTFPIRAALALLALVLLLGPLAGPAAAQEAAAPSYSFAEMGFGARELVSPSDRQQLTFSLPAGQQAGGAAALDLVLRTVILDTATAALPADEAADLGGAIVVSFNGTVLESLPLTAEPERTVSLDIPAAALAAEGGRYTIQVELRTETDCAFGDAIRVTVGEDSRLTLPTEAAPISADLRALPAPLFQRSFLPETALLVVPDEPTAGELRAAMLVAGTLGRQTGGRLGLTLRRSGDLAKADYAASHLVFVGVPTKLPLLSEIELPVALEDGVFTAANLGADDGVVAAARSPWDETKLALAVGGNSEAGLLKAAEAFALNRLLLTEEQPALSLIADVNRPADDIAPVEGTFADLGYSTTRRIAALGTSSVYYEFNLPAGQAATEDAFVEIAFTHAALVDYDRSGFAVVLNGNEIGGVRLSEETVQLTRSSFLLPSAALRPGRNELQIRASLLPRNECVGRDGLDLWLNIWPQSRISVPLEPAGEQQLRSVSLDEFPALFTGSPSLATTALVVGADDPESWQAAAQIAGSLASAVNSAPLDLAVAFDGAVPEELRQSHNIVLVGRPSQLATVGELNERLPAPFEPDSDVAIDRVSQVAFRLAEQENVGYLELTAAPWNEQRFVLSVLGNSPAGVAQASQALTRGDLRAQLGGSFAIVVGEQVFIGGTRLATAAAAPGEGTAAPSATASAVITDTTQPVVIDGDVSAPSSGPPLLLAFVASVAVMLAVVGGVVGWSFYRRRQSGQ